MEKEKKFDESKKSLSSYLRGQATTVALAATLSIGMVHTAMAEAPNNHNTPNSTANPIRMVNWVLQSGITMTEPGTFLSWMVKAVKREQKNGYGYMAIGNIVTNNSYICQVGLGYNWPMQDGTYRKGFRLVVNAFRPDGNIYALSSAENNPIIKEFDGTIKEGQYIQLDIGISNGMITITALNTFEKKEMILHLPVEGAKEFIGSEAPFSKTGMETGLMVEEHMAESNDALTSSGAPITLLMEPNKEKVYPWMAEWNTKTKQLLFRRSYNTPVHKGSINYFGLRTSYDSSEAALVFGSEKK